MTDTYLYLIHEPDWDSDAYADGAGGDLQQEFPQYAAFSEAVTRLGARIVGGEALHSARYGGRVRPGEGSDDERVGGAVYTDGPFPDTAEVVSGFYLVETDDEAVARRIAALVPSGGYVEWRKVFPMS
ncbi:hypothetical protein BJ978_000723 [Agromyces terreus]|uniref:YCII-related domain-containing protein n=1 Tax=Agromyces terreus TaxID=424795 RepID=A0A9X2KDY0_9MICO|nr:YciI family protein [Agromyces terreus]MCP2370047.1 hypothetical protein [Agromyces terreus]